MPVESNARPRLALVPGSGGVRSDTAVGVAEVLVAEGMHPDRNTGRRLGALLGATIAPGLDRHVGLWETGAMPHFFEARRRTAGSQLPQIAAFARESPLCSRRFGPLTSR